MANAKDILNKGADAMKKSAKAAAKAANEGAKVAGKAAKEGVKAAGKAANIVKDKAGEVLTQENLMQLLDSLYQQSVDGISNVSPSVDELISDYMKHNASKEAAAKSLINNTVIKCGTSGFITGFGGFVAMAATLPANITSVMYFQIRMCCAIAKLGGYDEHEDQVQTLVYACLTGSAMADIVKQAGIKIGNKFAKKGIEKISGKTLTAINRKVGFRLLTKFGEKGAINLGKMIPVVGAVVGGSFDMASAKTIGYNAYKVFIKNEMPTKDEEEKDDVIDAEINVVNENSVNSNDKHQDETETEDDNSSKNETCLSNA